MDLSETQCTHCGTEDWDLWLSDKHGADTWMHYIHGHEIIEEHVPLMDDYSDEEKTPAAEYKELPESPIDTGAEPAEAEAEAVLRDDSGCESDIEADNEEEPESASSKPDSRRDYPSGRPSIVDTQVDEPPQRTVPYSSPYLKSARPFKPGAPDQQESREERVSSEAALPLSMPRPARETPSRKAQELTRLCNRCWRRVPWYFESCNHCEARESLARLPPGPYKSKVQSYLIT